MPKLARKLKYGLGRIAKAAGKQFLRSGVSMAGAALGAPGIANAILAGKGMYGRRRMMLKGKGLYTGMGRYRGRGMYTGQGNYIPDANNLLGSSKSTMEVVPLFAPESDDGIIYSKREYVSEIYGPPLIGANPAPFVLQEYNINPGLERVFPWLSQIAANFDEYEMMQLCFTFKSTTTESGNQTNGQVGTVIMATNYNAAAPVFTEKFTMMQYASACSGRLTETLQHFVECDPKKLSGSVGDYVRTNPVVTNQDLKTYDHGKFQIAIANCTANLANQSLGELWVSYTVKLRKPKFFTGRGLAISKDIFLSYPSTTESYATEIMGRSYLRGQQNNIGIRLTNGTNGRVTITFPAYYAGFLRLTAALDATNIGGTVANFYPVNLLTGNVQLVEDLYGHQNSFAPSDAPFSQIYNNATGNVVTVPTTLGFTVTAHLKVEIATNGIDNAILLEFPLCTVVNQAYIEIAEYNAGFSYAANNLGSSFSPIWVTSTGQVVVP